MLVLGIDFCGPLQSLKIPPAVASWSR